ncbi:MAG: DUF2845 domain-containing protein [Acidobacteriia bacterium]|nr:DUF2845 domain-containing protein [Terriglobia bacterium]
MKSRYVLALAFFLLALVAVAGAGDQKSPSATQPAMSKPTRMDLIRTFNAELVYIRSAFPMGKKGLTLKDGKISPDAQELQQLIAMWGPAVKPGDRAMITAVVIKDDRIHFEINGGPVKKQKWYQRITISGGSGSVPMTPSDSTANPRGSYLDLMFDHYVPELNPQQLKDLLRPVFDFDSKSPLEAYLDTVPPKVREAIKNHQVLVGMNRDMVLYAKGRPPGKEREKDGDIEYEEWIYGQPPQDVEFVRFVGDEVVRVETMKVGGEKVVRTDKEVDIESQPKVAKGEEPQPRPANAPSLRRPGEPVDTAVPTTVPSSTPLPPLTSPPPQSPPSTPDPGAGQIPH